MELYWYIVVIIFIIIKIFFYVCWYRSRQRQLAAYLSNPRNAQIVIVGGRAYLHQVCERPSTSIWPSWYGVQDEVSMEEASAAQPPAPAFSQLDMPPPYEAVSGEDDLKPPSYSECARGDGGPPPSFRPLADGVDAVSINEAPPPYTPSAGGTAAASASSSSAATPANRQEAPARQGQ